jgi:hypothetical protein
MIFLTQKIRNTSKSKIEVTIYESLEDLSQRVEWQDILDDSLKIMDEDGKLYVWDDSNRNEVGTVFNYSFKTNGTDAELIKKVKDEFTKLGQPDSFVIEQFREANIILTRSSSIDIDFFQTTVPSDFLGIIVRKFFRQQSAWQHFFSTWMV